MSGKHWPATGPYLRVTVERVLPAAEQTCPLPAGSSPFLEPDPIVPGPSAAPRSLAPQA